MNPSGSGVVLVDEFSHFLQASEEHHAFHDGLAAAAKENRVGYTESVTGSHTVVDNAAPGAPPAGWSPGGAAAGPLSGAAPSRSS